MAFHVLGFLTLAADLGVGAWLARRLWTVGSRPWSWQHPVRVPQLARGYRGTLSSGTDYVGHV